jgi:DHA2 family multidrug resistance protein-like MFS transporter
MGSLPPNKAGVGSAVNDTVREVGGALGVAVLGSVLTSQYTSAISASTTGLTEGASRVADDSLGGAVGVAQELGGTTGAALLDAAQAAYVDGFGLALTVAAFVALAGAAVAAIWLPSREPAGADERSAPDETAIEGALTAVAVLAA